jgi:hypothetical protein
VLVVVTAPRRDRLVSLFAVIHASAHEGSGALHFGDGPRGGVVLFDAGRVCWAAIPGAGRRLFDLVCAHAEVSRPEVQSAYAECRARGVAFGELLVERKLVAAAELRDLLLRQTSENLVLLAERDAEPVWVAHRGAGYQPRFAFTLPEIAASTTAAGLAIDVTAARGELAAVIGGDGAGAAFDVDVGGRPLAFAVRGELDYDEIHALGAWVIEVASRWPSDSFPGFIVASMGAGGLVAWATGGCLFGARFDSAPGLIRALAHLKRRT